MERTFDPVVHKAREIAVAFGEDALGRSRWEELRIVDGVPRRLKIGD